MPPESMAKSGPAWAGISPSVAKLMPSVKAPRTCQSCPAVLESGRAKSDLRGEAARPTAVRRTLLSESRVAVAIVAS